MIHIMYHRNVLKILILFLSFRPTLDNMTVIYYDVNKFKLLHINSSLLSLFVRGANVANMKIQNAYHEEAALSF